MFPMLWYAVHVASHPYWKLSTSITLFIGTSGYTIPQPAVYLCANDTPNNCVTTGNGGQSYVIFHSINILRRLMRLVMVLASFQIKCKKYDRQDIIWYQRLIILIYNSYRVEIIFGKYAKMLWLRHYAALTLWCIIKHFGRAGNILVYFHKSILGWAGSPSLTGHQFRKCRQVDISCDLGWIASDLQIIYDWNRWQNFQ